MRAAVEGRRFLTEALERVKMLPPPEGESARARIKIQAKALFALGVLCFGQGDNAAALKAFEESKNLAHQLGALASVQFLSGLAIAAACFAALVYKRKHMI